ncbi:MAG: hypothetical protein IJN29_03700 [Akkermansia sp.]|nr:hypothetical protein [Akkermansia sp.]
MKLEQLTEDGQDLRRVMGDSPVATPDDLAAFGDCLLQKMRRIAEEQPAPLGRKWGTTKDVMRLYGLKKARASELLSELKEARKVRIQKPSGADKKGTYYHLGDIEKAWNPDTPDAK